MDVAHTKGFDRGEDGPTCGHHVIDQHDREAIGASRLESGNRPGVVSTGPSRGVKRRLEQSKDRCVDPVGQHLCQDQGRVDSVAEPSAPCSWDRYQRQSWKMRSDRPSYQVGISTDPSILEVVNQSFRRSRVLERGHHPDPSREYPFRSPGQQAGTEGADDTFTDPMTHLTKHVAKVCGVGIDVKGVDVPAVPRTSYPERIRKDSASKASTTRSEYKVLKGAKRPLRSTEPRQRRSDSDVVFDRDLSPICGSPQAFEVAFCVVGVLIGP